jgi:hypothetical protein
MANYHRKKPEAEASDNKLISELKQENRTLKRQVARLQKQIVSIMSTYYGLKEEKTAKPMAKKPEVPKCEKCHAPGLKTVSMAGRIISRCLACLHTSTTPK